MDGLAHFHKAQLVPPGLDVRQAVRDQIAQLPAVQGVEITGVHPAVGLHHQLPAADAAHAAGFRPAPLKEEQEVVEIAVILPLAPLGILVPAVEQVLEVLAEPLRRQGPGMAAPLLAQGVQTGDVLLPGKAVPPVKAVDAPDVPGRGGRHHRQDVEIHLVVLQQLDGVHHRAVGALSLGVQAVLVVEGLVPVQGDSHQEMVLGEEGRPLLGHGVTVGLDGVFHRDVAAVELLFQLHHLAEKGEPRHGGLSPLKGDGAAGRRAAQDLLQHGFQGFFGHDAVGGCLAVGGFVGVKAVPAAHIAKRAGRFDHDHGNSGHKGLPSPIRTVSVSYSSGKMSTRIPQDRKNVHLRKIRRPGVRASAP